MVSNQQLKKLFLNKTVCEIKWLDIVSKHREDVEDVDEVTVTALLTTFKSYGFIYKYDDYALLLCTEIQDDGDDDKQMDYTVIPLHNITDIKELKGGK